jgi:hypothetical protein
MKLFLNKRIKTISLAKFNFCNKDKNYNNKDYYQIMEENIKKYENKDKINLDKNETTKDKDDIQELLKILKCPMTDSLLEQCEEGLKVGHIIYPKREGIYILLEEEAIFKF